MARDDHFFDQLDRLERSARVTTRPTRDVYHDSSAEYSSYEEPPHYAEEGSHHPERAPEGYDLTDEPMTLDSFDEQLLRQPDHSSRQGQAALGRARLSLPPSAHAPPDHLYYDTQIPAHHVDPPAPRRFDLSRFALTEVQYAPPTSSRMHQALPSSPTFRASQRQPAPAEYGRPHRSQPQRDFFRDVNESTGYEPFTAEQLEAEERTQIPPQPSVDDSFRPSYAEPRPHTAAKRTSKHGPVVQGINLVSTHALPDRLRASFPYPLFNAIQSKAFDAIFNSNSNFVLSAPTGSGKTAVLELAVCRLINTFASDSFKIVYQAPTKSLCAERQRDWQAKFGTLGLECAELTGDTDNSHMRNVQQASIIITTPEKWDSITRKWKDHQKLMQMVKLFLIDEVHILKEERGATLEAVVSRMKSVGSDVRFVALSATVPNSDDIAAWLGRDPMNPQIPALREKFGEEFRPVRLKKHVCGYQASPNDFAFEKSLSGKLPEVISKYSQHKPIMVFCFTRNACVETAKMLATWWSTKSPKDRYWEAPLRHLVAGDKELRDTMSSGVAFHHAGLSIEDRNIVEKGYLDGNLNVICCTSTLAVGVNLPCHMVIIKGTVTYQGGQAGGCKEYSDLEIMQMLGRAGRPQFDDSAVAVILTRTQRVPHYEQMISGQEVLESCLHRNLIDHLNAEIGLGTISSASSAKKWLTSTFLYVRLKDNPDHYKIDGDASSRNLDDRLEKICSNGIALLEETDLVCATPKLRCTEFGDAMARYYLQFETMRVIMALPPKAKIFEILSAVAQAAEYKEVRFRAGEKPIYKDLNKNTSIKFPIPVNLDLPAHKISLIIQSVLGALDLPTEEPKHRLEYATSKAIIFQHATRLIRCIVDCQLYLEDAVTTRNALMLARSIGAQVWDDSPLHMKQLESIGLVYVRKLVNAGMRSIEDLEATEAHRIEQAVSRNPPFGRQVQDKAKAFPKLRIAIKMVGEPQIKKEEHVSMKIRAEIGFLNEKVPDFFQRKPVYVCLLAETSDGHKVHFARISAKKLSKGQDVLFAARLTEPNQSIRAYVMCDEIAGTMRHAVLTPDILPQAFPVRKAAQDGEQHKAAAAVALNTAKRRLVTSAARSGGDDEDEFADPDLDDADLAMAEAGGFMDIDDFDDQPKGQPKAKKRKITETPAMDVEYEPQQLANGKWACNHRCGDKTVCKHLCCREGTDKKPKPPKPKTENKDVADPGSDPKQTQLNMPIAKKSGAPTQTAQSTSKAPLPTPSATAKPQARVHDSREVRDLDRLHNSVKTRTPTVPTLGSRGVGNGAGTAQHKTSKPRMSFLEAARNAEDDDMSDYGNASWEPDDLPNLSDIAGPKKAPRKSAPKCNDDVTTGANDEFGADEDDALGSTTGGNHDGLVDFSSFIDDYNLEDDDSWKMDFTAVDNEGDGHRQGATPKPMPGPSKNSNFFVGYSSESAVNNVAPSTKPGVGHKTVAAAGGQSSDPKPYASEVELPKTTAQTHQAKAAAQTVQDTVLPATEQKEDDIFAWFKANIGGEDTFNFID